MNVLHFLITAETGGIESLCRDYADHSELNNIFAVLKGVNSVNAFKMKQAGHTVVELDHHPRKLSDVWMALVQQTKAFSIDVIVVHHASPILYLLTWGLKKKFPKIRVIAYAHSEAEDLLSGGRSTIGPMYDWILRYSFKRSDKVIAISKAVQQSLIRCFHLSEDKISIIYNGVELRSFEPRLHFAISSPIRFLYVGRLVPEKGVQNTLQALSQLPQQFSQDWRFDIIGDGAYRKQLEADVSSLNLTNNVRFWGAKNNIPAILKEYDVFIHMPAYEEGFGITVVEALASGLLCVCGSRGGIPEIITNGENGILVRTNCELQTVLADIIRNKEDRKYVTIRKNGIKRAEDFSIRTFSKELDAQIQLA